MVSCTSPSFLFAILAFSMFPYSEVRAFQSQFPLGRNALFSTTSRVGRRASMGSHKMAQVSEQEAKKGIDKVVNALRRDTSANEELGRLDKVTNVLGYGSPTSGILAVRFNAAFKKAGFGLSSVPLPFGLGQSNQAEGRGQMVGQVKASIDVKSGKVTSCSVFRDLGYGRAFNLKV